MQETDQRKNFMEGVTQRNERLEYIHTSYQKLKEQNEKELFSNLADVSVEWESEQRHCLDLAHQLASRAHHSDRHKDRPYIQHVLRVANRLSLPGYMEINNPDLIIAAILHDIVEDHVDSLLDGSLGLPVPEKMPQTPQEKQALALDIIELCFSSEVARIVAAVTNAARGNDIITQEEKYEQYSKKVAEAAETFEGWALKTADWCDNGLAVLKDLAGQGNKHGHFKRKYWPALLILEARFYDEDIQSKLTEDAKQYLIRQFALGHERLAPASILLASEN